MKSQLLLAASLSGCVVGCVGAPFSLPLPTVDAGAWEDAGADSAAADDRAIGLPLTDATPDVGPSTDADPPGADAANEPPIADAAPEAATCSPVTATPHDVCPLEPASPNPFPSCYDRMAAAPPAGCPTINACEPTPAACQCAETFNCACLRLNGALGKNVNCKDVGGAPWVF